MQEEKKKRIKAKSVFTGKILNMLSIVLFIAIDASAVPNPPTGITARAGDGQVLISWTAPVSTEGLLVTNYTVTSNPGGLTCVSSVGSPVGTSCTITGLTNNTSYTFTVEATTTNGTSVASAPSNAVTPLAGVENVNFIGTYGKVRWNAGYARALTSGVPDAFPTNIYANTTYNGYLDSIFTADQVNNNLHSPQADRTSNWKFAQILLDPEAPTGPGRNSHKHIYKYNTNAGITFSSSNANRSGIAVVDLGVVRTFTTLRIFQMYSDGKVTDVKMSISSTTGDVWPLFDDASWTTVVPRSPVGAGYGANQNNQCGTCPSIYDFGATSARYLQLEFWNAGQFGSFGYIEVQGVKLFFENTLVSIAEGCPPEPPTDVSATAGNTKATVSWVAPVGSVITGYELQKSDNGGSSWTTATTDPTTVSGSGLSAQVTGLVNTTAYLFRVRAINSAGSSPYSSASAPVTPLAALPDPPTGLSAVAGVALAVVSWTASPEATSYTVTGTPFGSATIDAPATICTVTGLTSGLSYTFTVTATNAHGTSGPSASTNEVIPFRLPVVSTQAVSAIATTTATGNGNITDLGVPNPTAHGICWHTSTGPTTAHSVVNNGASNSTGAFAASMTGLTPGITYYVKAYATNRGGTVYGDEVSFTTIKVPTVTTQAVSSIAPTTVTGNGTIVDLGVPNPTAHGVCWHTSTGPTTANSVVNNNAASTTGAFTAAITGLTPGTTYYVRAYATNSTGTVYGDEVSFTTNKLIPSITTWPVASPITYGQQLSSSALSGSVVVTSGTFSFGSPSTVPSTGTAKHPVIFTPSDTAMYLTASDSVSVTVGKGTPTITTWPVASPISYGQQLSSSNLSGAVVVTPGTFAFGSSSTIPAAGTAKHQVFFTPSDTANYLTASDSVSVTVGKGAPIITTWPIASPIASGQPLSSSNLSGAEVVTPGTFAFESPSTIPAGTAKHPVLFTPSDTTNYLTASDSVSVTVGKCTPTITTWPVASPITYGQQLSSSNLSGAEVVTPGTFAFNEPSTGPSAGTSKHPVFFTPADTAVYLSASDSVIITVAKKELTVIGMVAADKIFDGTRTATLSGGTLSGIVGEDTVLIDTCTGTFSDSTAGLLKPITVTVITLSGAQASNYTVAFPTGITATIIPQLLAPSALRVDSLRADSTVSILPRFSWNAVFRASAYRVQIAMRAELDTVYMDTTNTDTFFTPPPLPYGTRMFWRVMAQTSTEEGPWSQTGNFTTFTPPPIYQLRLITSYPDTLPSGAHLTLCWASSPDSTGYKVQIAVDSVVSELLIDTVIADTAFTFSIADTSIRSIYWQVTTYDEAGAGLWSPPQQIHFRAPHLEAADEIRVVPVLDPVVVVAPGVEFETSDSTIPPPNVVVSLTQVSLDKAIDTSKASGGISFANQPVRSFDLSGIDSGRVSLAFPDTLQGGTVLSAAQKAAMRLYYVNLVTGRLSLATVTVDTGAGVASYTLRKGDRRPVVFAIDSLSPQLTDNTTGAVYNVGTRLAISGNVTDNVEGNSVCVYFRKGGSTIWDSTFTIVVSSGAFSVSIPGSSLSAAGLEYFVRASDGANISLGARTNISVRVSGYADTIPIPANRWRLISAPLAMTDSAVTHAIAGLGTYGADWWFFRRALSSVKDSFVEYGPNLTSMNVSCGYWLRTGKNGLSISVDSGITTPLTSAYPVTIPSNSWAAIGTPYAFPVSWKAVRDSTGPAVQTILGPYSYQDSAWVLPVEIDKIEPWQGYYVYNYGDSAVTLKIPSYSSHGGFAKRASDVITSRFEWIVSCEGERDYRNYFGFASGAGDGYDEGLDCPKPGSPEGKPLSTWFSQKETNFLGKRFQSDFTSEQSGGAKWSPVVGGLRAGEEYTCAVVIPEGSSMSVVLVDERGGKLHDLRSGPYSFTPLEKEAERRFEIVAGSQDYVAKHTAMVNLLPQQFSLLRIGPNPVRGPLTIRYAIPWSANGVRVKIDLFDLKGRLVANIANKLQSAGYHTVRWGGVDASGLAGNGTYILRVRADRKVKQARIMVVR